MTVSVCYNIKTLNAIFCTDINECAKDNGWCTKHSTCKNTPGSYECVCDKGYKAYGSKCVCKLKKLTSFYVLVHIRILLYRLTFVDAI